MTDDPKISQRYRELPREEPPRHLDEAILAASRRAAETRPAPLVVPSGRRRWYFPLAAAAIIVLAVAVTVHVEREQPDQEIVPLMTPPKDPAEDKFAQTESAVEPAKPAAKTERFTPDPKPAPSQEQRDAAPLADLQKAQPAPASPAPPPAAASESPSRQDAAGGMRESEVRQESRARASREGGAAPPVAGAMGRSFAYRSPEQWLQGIADLRRQERHEEADKALAEFRKSYPDYKIPAAMLETLEKRAR